VLLRQGLDLLARGRKLQLDEVRQQAMNCDRFIDRQRRASSFRRRQHHMGTRREPEAPDRALDQRRAVLRTMLRLIARAVADARPAATPRYARAAA